MKRIPVLQPDIHLTVKYFSWLRCQDCGWEHEMAAMVNQCPNCSHDDSLHIISNRDGEVPRTLPRHASSCSNQNPIDAWGAYRGVNECGCVFVP